MERLYGYIHKKLKPEDFIMPSTISLAKYDGNGNIIEGTAISGSSKRTYGMDYFSKTILSEKADEVQVLKDKKYQKEVLKNSRILKRGISVISPITTIWKMIIRNLRI